MRGTPVREGHRQKRKRHLGPPIRFVMPRAFRLPQAAPQVCRAEEPGGERRLWPGRRAAR